MNHFVSVVQSMKMEFSHFFKIPFQFFKVSGFKLKYENNLKDKLMQVWFFYGLTLGTLVFVGGTLFTFNHFKDIESVAESSGFTFFILDLLIKFSNFYMKRSELLKFLKELKTLSCDGKTFLYFKNFN